MFYKINYKKLFIKTAKTLAGMATQTHCLQRIASTKAAVASAKRAANDAAIASAKAN